MPQTEMMAIGDSLFNGVRSLTIDADLARWSAPAQVARALGVADFAIPDYPKNVVINFEKWLREFPNVAKALQDLSANVDFWRTFPKSGLSQFDNIAIASTTYGDMLNRTWKTAQGEIDAIFQALGPAGGPIAPHVAELFFAFNTRFLLNPTADPNAPAMTSLDIVAARKPRRLLVSIGANNGLWDMAFSSVLGASLGAPGGPYNARDVADLTAFVDALKALPPEIEHIYFNTLPPPGTTANMMPIPEGALDHKPGPGKYFHKYENRFGFNYGRLMGPDLAVNDGILRDLNAAAATLVGADGRIHFVAMDKAFVSYDFKTDANAKTVKIDKKVLSNISLETPGLFWPWQGGLIGLDGMHPSIVGYGVMAQQILNAIAQNEGIVVQPIDLDAAYAADTLLNRTPGVWDDLVYLWRDIRQAMASGEIGPAQAKAQPVKQLMAQVQFKVD